MNIHKWPAFWILLFCLCCYLNKLANIDIPDSFVLNPINLIPFIITIYLLTFIKLKLVRVVLICWLIYFQFGLLFTTQSYYKNSFWKLSIDQASIIYGVYLLSFTIFSLIFEKYIVIKDINKRYRYIIKRVPNFINNIILIFPFLWIISFFVSIGYLPILSGNAFYDNVYNSNYGILYGYVAFISVSIITAYSIYDKAINKNIKRIFIFLILIFVVISVVDGKRYTVLTSVIGIFAFYSAYQKKTIPRKNIIVIISFVIFIYAGMHLARVGQFNLKSLISATTDVPIGVEFRDFVYTENNYQPGTIKEYDFAKSAIASLLSRKIMDVAGLDKDFLSQQGSAYAWKKIYYDLFKTDFGIRTGIISELYFAYSFYGIFIFAIFSYILVKISTKIEYNSSNELHVIVYCVIYALYLMIIVGQTTAFIGQSMLLFYIIIFHKIYLVMKY